MREDEAPPIPPPHGAEAPYPEYPAPHPQRDEALEKMRRAGGMGPLGVTLIGGAVAAAVGLLVAIPLVRRAKGAKRKPAARARPASQARRPRRKRAED
jgi:hypothetical protein